jgi:hypothetical protein
MDAGQLTDQNTRCGDKKKLRKTSLGRLLPPQRPAIRVWIHPTGRTKLEGGV